MSGRRKRKDRHHCPLAAALLGQYDEIAEAEQAAVRAARPKRPRFDPDGRRLARIHTLYRAGRGADSGKVLPLIRDLPSRGETGSRRPAFRSASSTPWRWATGSW
jgi:hypothetical protein